MDKRLIEQAIKDAANETHPALLQEIETHGADTILFGRGAILDSLALVALIASIEGWLQAETGKDVLLVSEAAMSRSSSPFRTVGLFTQYIHEVVKGGTK